MKIEKFSAEKKNSPTRKTPSQENKYNTTLKLQLNICKQTF